MSELVAATDSRSLEDMPRENLDNFVTFIIKVQLFGIPVLKVQDILSTDKIAAIPLAPPAVTGSINLRGRIVTVLDVRVRLGLEKRKDTDSGMGVTVEVDNELYTLLVDKVGDVIGLSHEEYENNPGTLDAVWREFANGIYSLEDQLMIVLDVDRLLDLKQN